jgi:hypothetical protein
VDDHRHLRRTAAAVSCDDLEFVICQLKSDLTLFEKSNIQKPKEKKLTVSSFVPCNQQAK